MTVANSAVKLVEDNERCYSENIIGPLLLILNG